MKIYILCDIFIYYLFNYSYKNSNKPICYMQSVQSQQSSPPAISIIQLKRIIAGDTALVEIFTDFKISNLFHKKYIFLLFKILKNNFLILKI